MLHNNDTFYVKVSNGYRLISSSKDNDGNYVDKDRRIYSKLSNGRYELSFDGGNDAFEQPSVTGEIEVELEPEVVLTPAEKRAIAKEERAVAKEAREVAKEERRVRAEREKEEAAEALSKAIEPIDKAVKVADKVVDSVWNGCVWYFAIIIFIFLLSAAGYLLQYLFIGV
jgi:hypothetical protein